MSSETEDRLRDAIARALLELSLSDGPGRARAAKQILREALHGETSEV